MVGRDMAQVAQPRPRREASPAAAARPPPIRPPRDVLPRILRTLAEAAGDAAPQGRAGWRLELLAVEQASPQVTPVVAATPAPQPVAVAAPPAAPHADHPPDAEPVAASPRSPVVAEPTAAAPRPEPAPPPAASPTALPADGVAGIRARWAEVVASASPALRPLLSECRPVALRRCAADPRLPGGARLHA